MRAWWKRRKTNEILKPSTSFTWLSRITGMIMALALCFLLVVVYWLTVPYSDIELGDRGPIITEEFTSDGVPVVREGSPIMYEQRFCSTGIGSTVNRWMDVYGPYTGVPAAELKRSVSFEIPRVVVEADIEPSGDLRCDTVTSREPIPDYINAGAVYAFRIEVSYHPNPMRTVTVSGGTTAEDRFLYLPIGAPIP